MLWSLRHGFLYHICIHTDWQQNGVPWPYFDVEPRKYRFRLLDAAVSRSFSLYFVDTSDENTRIPFQVIASDSGLLEEPVTTSKLVRNISSSISDIDTNTP